MRRSLPLLLLLLTPALAQEALAPNENLVADGLPPIPASVAAAVASYTEARAANFCAWEPKKRAMLVTTRFGEVSQVHHVRGPLGARKQLTFGKERITRATFPRHRDDYFVFARDAGGGEFYQNHRYDLATGRITLLTDGRSRNSLGPWSHAGDRLAYASTRRNRKDADLWVVDPARPETDRLVAELPGSFHPLDWSPDDARILVSEYVSANESHLWLVDAETGKRTELTPRGEKVSWRGGTFAPDAASFFVATDAGSEFHRLARFDVATRKASTLTPDTWDVESFDLAPDGKTLAYVANQAGVGVLHLLDLESGKDSLPALPPGSVSGIAFREDVPELAVELSSARAPQDVFSVNLRSGAIDRWTESEAGPIDLSSLPEPETIAWPTFDERTITGFLYRPPARFEGRRPVIVLIHGGPEGQARPGFLGRWSYFPNELGVALVYPNVRGSAGFGKTFLALDNGRKREDSIKDLGALLDWIAKQPGLDADRVMVMGGSYGGYATLAVATTYPDRIRCAIDSVGISNFVSFLERTEAYRRDLRRAEYGDERDPEMRRFLLAISPLTRADKIVKPLFVIQGKNDPRVPAAEAEQIVQAVRKNGTKVWYLLAKDEGHGFSKKANVDFQLHATVQFVREHLLK